MSRRIISAEKYQELWEDDPEKWSIVPSTYAAKIVGKSLPSIEDLVEKDILDVVMIEGDDKTWKGVTMSSLIRYPEKIKSGIPSVDNVFSELENVAASMSTIYYSDFMRKIGLNHANPHHRRLIGMLLCEASEITFNDKNRGFMLSVLVVNKSTGMPTESFFVLAKKLKALSSYEDHGDFFKRQTRLVFKYYEN